jgi:hypothetical protein
MTIQELFKKISEASPSDKEGLERSLSEELENLTELDTAGLNSDQANYLLARLGSNTNITKLIIRQTLSESIAKNLETLLAQNKKISHLHIDGQALGYIPINMTHMTHLTEGLAHNSTLTTLEISGYRIADKSMDEFSKFLVANHTLNTLNLKECDKFTPDDADMLFKAIAANDTLKYVSLVNREEQWLTFKSGALAINKLNANRNKKTPPTMTQESNKEVQQTHPIPQHSPTPTETVPAPPEKENDTAWMGLSVLALGLVAAALALIVATPIVAASILAAFVVVSSAIALWPSIKKRFEEPKTSTQASNANTPEPAKIAPTAAKASHEPNIKKPVELSDANTPDPHPKINPPR